MNRPRGGARFQQILEKEFIVKIIANLVAIGVVLSACSCALGDPVPIGYSGMEQIDRDSYLVVQDKKVYEDGDRLGILKIRKGQSPTYSPVVVGDWKHEDGRASDLESICSLSGKDDEYLLAESGYWEGKFGRIFHVKHRGATAEVLHVYHLPEIKGNSEDDPDGDNFEGMACVRDGGTFFVVIGERGGSNAYRNGVLRIGVLDYDKSSLSWDKYSRMAIDIAAPGTWECSCFKRSISDLHVDRDGVLWAVATEDKSDDGPFRSVIYRAALISIQNRDISVIPVSKKQASWVIEGFKVESLSGPTSAVTGSFMSFATEDEHYPGQWRPLFHPAD